MQKETGIFLAASAILLVLLSGCSSPGRNAIRNTIVGGPCSYKSYDGECKIISISQTTESKGQASIGGGAGYAGFDVEFQFTSKIALESKLQYYEESLGRNYSLMLSPSWYPGPKFIEKYGIKERSVFGCQVKLEINGTCTPVYFEFDKINTSDLFEAYTK